MTSGAIRRHATIVFSDLCDYTALNEVADPEEVDLILHRVRGEVERVLTTHGGFANEWYGDGVLCIFGVPHATEEDAKHAIEAVLEMHEAVRGLERELPVPNGFEICLHSGVASGVVFARERDGSPSYELIGDAVNTAARLCARARRDEVWATEATLGGFKDFFETEPVEPLALKGKSTPVPACRVIARTSVLTRFAASQRRGLTPLVGRDEALTALHQSLLRSLENHVQLINVIGGPGIGKTRMLEEFKRRLPEGIHVVVGHCDNAPNVMPLQPFVEILRQLVGLQPRSSKDHALDGVEAVLRRLSVPEAQRPALLHLLGLSTMPPSASTPESVQLLFVDALGSVFIASSTERPLVLVLDDWQWADDASRQVLGASLRLLRDAPAQLVVASRDLGDPLQLGHEVVTLQPFTREQSAKVIGALLPYALDLGFRRTIHEHSGGNPLFLEELCRALPGVAASGGEDLARTNVPATLRGIIQVRVERLPEPTARVLRAAAVIGNEIPHWLLQHLSEAPDLEGTLVVLAESDLIHAANDERTVRFKNVTTRAVVYDSVRLPERRRLHRAAALALEADATAGDLPEPYEALAYHYAGAGEYDRAARFAELAGDRAASSSSLDRAREQYRMALEALERRGLDPVVERQWMAIVTKWATASLYSPGHEHLELIARSGERALRLGDLVGAARADYWLGWFHYALGNQDAAVHHCREALRKAEQLNDQRLIGQLFLNLGQSLAAAGEYTEALKHLDAGLDLKRATGMRRPVQAATGRRPPLGFAYALACKGLLHGDVGEFAEAYGCFDDALHALEGTGHAVEGSCLGLLAMVQLLQGRWEDSLATAVQVQARAERVNGPYVFASSKTVSGYARWMLGRDREALNELLHAVQWMEERGTRLYLSFNYGYLAEALASAGETERAFDYATRAVERSKSTDPFGKAMACRVLARLLASNSTVDAFDHLEQALDCAHARRSRRELALTQLELLKLQRVAGRRVCAAPAPVELCQAFRAMGMTFYEHEAAALAG